MVGNEAVASTLLPLIEKELVVLDGGMGTLLQGMGLTQDPIIVAILFAAPLYGFLNVSLNALAAEYSRAEQRGGGLGVLNGVLAMGTIAGPLTGGALADRHGLVAVPWTALAFIIPAAVIAWWSLYRSAVEGRTEEKRVAEG